MKKILASSLVLICLFSSCKKETFTNEQQPLTHRTVTPKVVELYKEHSEIDLSEDWIEVNSCTGEILDVVEGIWHVTFHAVVTPDGRVVVKFHTNTSNYRLVNVSTGVEYTGSYVSNDQLTINLADLVDNAPFEQTVNLSVMLTTPGGGNNSTLKATYHITFNANGSPTGAWFDNWRFGCQ
ncbi:MAG: hypothetical protein V4717_12065 [Bacteroidota bacterium]